MSKPPRLASKRNQTPAVLRRLRAKTQSATAHLTREDDWDTEVPQIRLSRVFAIVLILHVVAVGGILAFQMINPEGAESAAKSDNVQGDTIKPLASGADPSLNDSLPPQPKIGDQSVRGLQQYRVKSGDSLPAIAAAFNAPLDEIERINKLDTGNKLYPGMILYLPNRQITPTMAEDVKNLLAQNRNEVVAVHNKREAGEPLVPYAVRDAEPAAPDIPRPAADQGGLASAAHNGPVTRAPAKTAPASADPAPASAQRSAGGSLGSVELYTVQQGDTAYGIGRRFDVSHDKILKDNGIKDPRELRAGQQLKIIRQ